jgi:hypothetical protein
VLLSAEGEEKRATGGWVNGEFQGT